MQLRKILPVILFSLSITACSTLVYRIDVPQGNYLEATQVAQVKEGMNKAQVQYLLGTPVLEDPFTPYRWYYVYLQQHAYDEPQQHTFVVNFNQAGIVTNFYLDKPLPKDPQAIINNTVISSKTAEPQKGNFLWFW